MKKVLYTATVVSHICQFHLPYLQMLKDMGYEVHVAARDNLAEKNGLKLEYADKFFDIPFRRSPFSPKNLGAKGQLKKIIDREGYDIIVCNTPVGGIMTRLAAIGARKRGTRVVYIAHGFHFYKGGPKKSWLIYYPIEKIFSKKCDAIVTITDEDYRLASEKFGGVAFRIHGMGVNGERHHTVSEGERAEMRRELGIGEGDFVCLCTGELNQNKNQASLIRLVPKIKEKIPGFKLWLAGNGPLRSELEELISELGLETDVTLLGYQPKIERYVRACDVVSSVSKREGLPFNIVEAMLTGRPVVASVNRGHRELIENGVTGFITDSQEELCGYIEALYSDKELYCKIAAEAERKAAAYTVASVKEEFTRVLFK
ncbi:MAG: glycosyltransferase family 4 protein [Clostridia bacterium]|nr:glycosyltransferase family 4 protein [Clostridia bacterium]